MQCSHKTLNVEKYLSHISQGANFYLGVLVTEELRPRVNAVGLTYPTVPGQRLLPAAKFGPASRRNALGFNIVHRDQPMETAYRQFQWTRKEYRGRDTVEVSETVTIPYKRYPRTEVPPYSKELEVKMASDGRIFVLTGPFQNSPDKLVVATNTANMLFEQLGGFEVLDEDLTAWVSAPVRKLNWEMLPPGKSPWTSAKPRLEELSGRLKPGVRGVVQERLREVGRYEPGYVAIGLGGFDGYVVFGFPRLGLCVLESQHVNNATYILNSDSWEQISQLSKAEILNANAHQGRVVHKEGWASALHDFLRPAAGENHAKA